LEEGKGEKAATVVDVGRGLCPEHAKNAEAIAPRTFTEPAPRRVARRTVITKPKPDAATSRLVTSLPLRLITLRLARGRTRNKNMSRLAKIAALTEASQFFEGKPGSVGRLVGKALELLEKKKIYLERASLYSFASGKITSAERANLGLKEKSKYNRKVE